MKLKLNSYVMSSPFRIVKRDGKFYIQERILFIFWIDLRRSSNSAFDVGCPPFTTAEQAKDWLTIFIRFRTEVIYPVRKIAIV